MTVRKGQEWGEAAALPAGAVTVRTDAEARALVEGAHRAGQPLPELGLLGGDLCRTLGGIGDEARLRSGGGVRVQIDTASVLVDGRAHWFVAHLVARRPGPTGWWRGRVVAVMNAQFLGPWDAAPRSHPNDGRLDTFDVTMSTADRWKARRRLLTGTHVPHPGIAQRRSAAAQFDIDGLHVWLDGDPLGPASTLSVLVEPDALICYV
ncbi:MAG: hypothetical protein ACT4PW_14380 [Acidimicrobiia bacterium]